MFGLISACFQQKRLKCNPHLLQFLLIFAVVVVVAIAAVVVVVGVVVVVVVEVSSLTNFLSQTSIFFSNFQATKWRKKG